MKAGMGEWRWLELGQGWVGREGKRKVGWVSREGSEKGGWERVGVDRGMGIRARGRVDRDDAG